MIKRLFKYTGIALLAIILILTTWVWYLYSTADMLAPNPEAGHPSFYSAEAAQPVIHRDYKQYGPNALRQSDSGLWELYVEGDASQRGEAIGRLSKDLLYYQEKVNPGNHSIR